MTGGKSFNKSFLEDCRSEEAFWINYGRTVRNLNDLINAIKNMKPETFRYHVNEDNNKNDFADWIRSILDNEELAIELEGIVDQEEYIDILCKKELELIKIKNSQ